MRVAMPRRTESSTPPDPRASAGGDGFERFHPGDMEDEENALRSCHCYVMVAACEHIWDSFCSSGTGTSTTFRTLGELRYADVACWYAHRET